MTSLNTIHDNLKLSIFSFNDFDALEALERVSHAMKEAVLVHYRREVPKQFPDHIAAFVGGRDRLNSLPIQMIHYKKEGARGPENHKQISYLNQSQLKGFLVMGMEKNSAAGQPWRPFLAFKIDVLRRMRLGCIRRYEPHVQTIYKVPYFDNDWKTLGPIAWPSLGHVNIAEGTVVQEPDRARKRIIHHIPHNWYPFCVFIDIPALFDRLVYTASTSLKLGK